MVGNFKSLHLLLVEDNEGDVILTKEAFEESKVITDISIAKNGKQALDFLYQREQFINASRPDLILLDINMPVYNGLEVLSKIKLDNDLKTIPVIMLTTSNSKKDIDLAYLNHAHNFIKKPLDIQELLEAVLKIEKFWIQIAVLAES